MQAGSLIVSDSMFYTSRVLVNGVARECASWSVGRELSGDLPAQVAAVSGLVQATGTIVWVEEYDVDGTPTTPFNASSGWLPRRGNRVEIYAGDGTNEWKVFTGLVDSSSGSVGESFQSQIIDDRDKLNKPFRHEPLLRVMPPISRGDANYRGVGLTYLYFVDAALRTAGFYATPPAEERQAVSVPAQSSMWPEVGSMDTGAVGGVSGGSWAGAHDSVDGVAISNALATYAPAISLPYGEPLRISMTVDPEHAGTSIISCWFGTDNRVQLSVDYTRTAKAIVNGVRVADIILGSATRVSMLIEGSNITLRTNLGTSATATSTPPTALGLSKVQLQGDVNARVAGFHVCYVSASTRWDYTDFTPSAHYRMRDGLLFGIIDAAPAILDGTCFDILNEISQATLSAMWIDEMGVFNWGPSPTLASGAPVRELNTTDDILSLPWEDNLLGTRSKVTVKQRVPAITVSRWDNVLWHQGSVETMESGQVKNDFISPETDEDWVDAPAVMLLLGDPGGSSASNSGHGSFSGAVLTDGSLEELGHAYLTASLTRINAATYKLSQSVGSLPSGKKLELRYPSESTTIWKRWLKQPFPIIRGHAKTAWADLEVTGSPAGPAWAPALEHESGPWLSREGGEDGVVIERLANYLAAQTSASLPTIGDMSVVPDPRLQLGDRVTISSDKYIGAVFTAIITGLSLGAGDSFSQSISVRLTSLESTFQSYDAWNSQYPGVLTYDQWAVLTTQTYDQFAISKD